MSTAAVTRQIPLLDLNAQHKPMRDEILAAITRVVDSQKFIMGDEIKTLEKQIAAYTGVAHGIGCASGSDALFLALLAAGVRHGDRVLTTPFTFFATAGAVTRAGATPVFVDIDPETYNIDPVKLAEALKANPRAKAIIPVHLFGACADMDPILDMAKDRGCVVIEDGAQSIGAEYKGRKAQSMGDIGCISFFPSKNLGGMGDGGMVLTNDDKLGKTLAMLRVHGTQKKYYHDLVGINSRLDTIQAAILLVKMKYLDQWADGRAKNADLYRQLLGTSSPVGLPVVKPYQTRHVYNQFVIRTERRDALKDFLAKSGIGTEVYYPLPLHLQVCYQDLNYREGDFPESEKAAKEVLAIPVHADLQSGDIEYVADRIKAFFA